jgi:HAMP domain-containing protein
MTLSIRLTAAMVGLVLVTATAVGLLTFHTVPTTFVLTYLAAVLGAVILAFLVAHIMTRPLVRFARAAEALPCTEPAALPISAGGEIGILARAFERMAADTRDKTNAYERGLSAAVAQKC